MKKFLSFIILMVYAVTGAWAGTIANNNGTITLDGLAAGDLDKALTDPTVWTSGNADDLNSATKVIFGSNVTLNDADLRALKTLVPAATQLNMAQVSLNEDANISNLETQAVEYLRLPNSMTSADDVVEMGKLKQNGNANLKMVGAYNPDNDNFDGDGKWAEVALQSFEANNVFDFMVSMGMRDQYNFPVAPCSIRMSGEYGDNDLVNHSGNSSVPNFGFGTSAEWDFTGAHFDENCTISEQPVYSSDNAPYYNYDDPFCLNGTVLPSAPTSAFYYFIQYKNNVVNIKLPDVKVSGDDVPMHLPPLCLSYLASDNKSGYVALYGEEAFNNNKVNTKSVPIETLTIPNCYTDLDQECGIKASIRHLVVGSNVKRIHGGAFLNCVYLEDLDFGAGLSDCYIGDRAFNECRSMKHIALSEGVVSLGNGAFWNSQQLESIRLPQTLINIGNHAFDNCLALSSITIPENVDKIGKQAFKLCPLTDIFLTTTDPDKIPIIWSAGTGFAHDQGFDGDCSFNHGHIDGWEGGVDQYADQINEIMSWDEAAAFYFMNWNGLPVMHYPEELAEKVRASISSTYAMKTKKDEDNNQYGLPKRSDMMKRDNIDGADLGSPGIGKWTRDGWAQFLMMKAYTTDPGGDVYSKEYDDVWYTMCFPFDLTDEQLASAFNETFNIVDFSGVEIDQENQALILHFNNVALTDYKDTEGNHYTRKKDENGNVIREQDGDFKYNVYLDAQNNEYHHVNVSSFLSSNKTKTFARNGDLTTAVIIDGVLATAGHPYMIHPAIGVNDGGTTKRRCDFAGITWKPQSEWAQLFEDNSRTVDLGIKKTLEELPDSNYNQSAYSDYLGQTYTFIGNPNGYDASVPAEPTVANGQLQAYNERPTKPAYDPEPVKEPYPEEPTMAPEPEAPTSTEITEEPTPVVTDPALDTDTYSESFQTLYGAVRTSWTHHDPSVNATVTTDYTYGEDLVAYDYSTFIDYHSWDGTYNYRSQDINRDYTSCHFEELQAFLGNEPTQEKFDALKTKATNFASAKAAYDEYLTIKGIYDAWQTYHADYADWEANAESNWQTAHSAWETACGIIDDNYTSAHSQWETNCTTIDNNYATALSVWQSECDQIDIANNQVISAWENIAKKYMVQIPKYAYFLSRAGQKYPKYYREMAEESYGGTRTTGLWPQFTAVIRPNTAAVNGVEQKINSGAALSKGFEMKFNEDFEGEFIDHDDIQTIIEDARKEGIEPKVEYMDVVVNINGQIVRSGSTSIEGLPKGVYIVNGKKYFVK